MSARVGSVWSGRFSSIDLRRPIAVGDAVTELDGRGERKCLEEGGRKRRKEGITGLEWEE